MLLEQSRDLAWLQPERLSLEPPREEERAERTQHQADERRDQYHRQVVAQLPAQRALEDPDRDETDHAAVPVADRDLRPHGGPEGARLDTDVLASRQWLARVGRYGLTDLGRVGVRVADPALVGDHDERRLRRAPHALGDGLDRRRRVLRRERPPDLVHRGDGPRDRERLLSRLLVELGPRLLDRDDDPCAEREHDDGELQQEDLARETEPQPRNGGLALHPKSVSRITNGFVVAKTDKTDSMKETTRNGRNCGLLVSSLPSSRGA
jgi:hypothetical protein